MNDNQVFPGKYVMVFDPRLWQDNGGDSKKDNFFRRARIIKMYRHHFDKPDSTGLADVLFDHDGRLSEGHFISGMEECK